MSAVTAPRATRAHRRRRLPAPSILAAMAVLALVAVAAILGTALAPYDPGAQDLLAGLGGPGDGHPLGTDDLGRDVLSRTIAGARTAVVGPLIVAIGAMLAGNLLGLLAGYHGGAVDTAISRVTEVVYSMPALLVAIVVVGVIGGGYFLAAALLILLFCPLDTRIVRGAVLEQRALPYVEAARTAGCSGTRIMFRHVWPNVLPLALAQAFLTFVYGLVTLSALSFLGFGVDPGQADWGRMLSENRTLLFDNPWTALAPCLALVLTAASMNIVGDWVAERLGDRGRAS